MVSYAPLWKTMQEKGITTYTLINQYKIQSKTIYNLKHGKNVTTATLESLCKILNCTPNDILTFEQIEVFLSFNDIILGYSYIVNQ